MKVGDVIVIEHDRWRNGARSTVEITRVDDQGGASWVIQETGARGGGDPAILKVRGRDSTATPAGKFYLGGGPKEHQFHIWRITEHERQGGDRGSSGTNHARP